MNNIQKSFKAKAGLGIRDGYHLADGGTVPDPSLWGFAKSLVVGEKKAPSIRTTIAARPSKISAALNEAGVGDAPAPQPVVPTPAPKELRFADGGRADMRGGGHMRGAGTGTSDSIPAMLSNGEYVLPADTVQHIGKENLDQIKAATHVPAGIRDGFHLVDGGYLDRANDLIKGARDWTANKISTGAAPAPADAMSSVAQGANPPVAPPAANPPLTPSPAGLRGGAVVGSAPGMTATEGYGGIGENKNIPAGGNSPEAVKYNQTPRGAFPDAAPVPAPEGRLTSIRNAVNAAGTKEFGMKSNWAKIGNVLAVANAFAPHADAYDDSGPGALSLGEKLRLGAEDTAKSAGAILGSGLGVVAANRVGIRGKAGALIGGLGGGYAGQQLADTATGGIRQLANSANSFLGGSPDYFPSNAEVLSKHGYDPNRNTLDIFAERYGDKAKISREERLAGINAAQNPAPTPVPAAPAPTMRNPNPEPIAPSAPVTMRQPIVVGTDGMATQGNNPVAGYGSMTDSSGKKTFFKPDEDTQPQQQVSMRNAYAPTQYSSKYGSSGLDAQIDALDKIKSGNAGQPSFLNEIRGNIVAKREARAHEINANIGLRQQENKTAMFGHQIQDNNNMRSYESSMFGHEATMRNNQILRQMDERKYQAERGDKRFEQNMSADKYSHQQDQDAQSDNIRANDALHKSVLGQLPMVQGKNGLEPDADGAARYMNGAQAALSARVKELTAAGDTKGAANLQAMGPAGLSETDKHDLHTGLEIMGRHNIRNGQVFGGASGVASNNPLDYLVKGASADGKKANLRGGMTMDLNDLTNEDMPNRIGFSMFNPRTNRLIGNTTK